MIKHIISLLALMTISVIGSAQTTQKLSASKVNEYGLIYSLPSTVIDVTVETLRTENMPGEFNIYSTKYLGIEPILIPSTTFTLKSITINQRAVSNPEERYLVQFKPGTTPYMILSDAGMPLAINSESIIPATSPTIVSAQAAQPTILETPAATQAITSEMLQAISSAKKAELAAARIFELRQNRNEIIAGSADNMPSDGQAMQLALDNLAAQESALTAMFTGMTRTSTQVETFTIQLPDSIEGDNWETVVARVSVLNGIVEADDLTGDPIKLTLSITKRASLPVNEKGEEKRFPKGGLAYCIPSTALISTEFMGRPTGSKEIEIPQYGLVFGLDPNLFTDKKAPAYAIFNPLTGALVEIGVQK